MSLPETLKKNFTFILFNVTIVAAIIGVGEIACVYYLKNPNAIPSSLKNAFQQYYRFHDRSIVQVTDCGKYDEELFYTLAPGDCEFNNREFSTLLNVNSQGIRDTENATENASIVVIGDSFSMGWGVNQSESYAEILEKNSAQNVLNASISSYGTAREIILLKRLQVNNPKTLIIQYHQTDFSENTEYVDNNYALNISSESTYDSLKKYISNRQNYFPGKHVSLIIKYYLKSLAPQKITPQDPSEIDAFLNVLTNAQVNLDSTKILLFEAEHISSINDDFISGVKEKIAINPSKYPKYIQEMKIISTKNLMTSEDFFILDNHLNAHGHNTVATILSKYL